MGFVTDTFLDRSGALFAGGAERHLYQLVRLAADLGAEPIVYQPAEKRGTRELDGIAIRSIPERSRAIVSAGCRQAVADGCRFVHFQTRLRPWQIASSPMATAAEHGIFWDIPFEPAAREWYPIPALTRLGLPWWRRFELQSALALVSRLRGILSADSGFLRLVQSYRPELRDRVHVALNFCDLVDSEEAVEPIDPYPPEMEPLIKARDAGMTVILVPRNISLVRGIWWLPDIAERVVAKTGAAVVFVVTGVTVPFHGRASRYERALRVRLEHVSPEVRPSLQFSGGIPHHLMPAAYRLSDIVLIPTFAHEASSLAAIEAMALARPVVATNIGGLNDVIDDRFTGLLVPPSVDKIAGAITELIENADLRNSLGANAQVKAKACFTLDSWRQRVRPFVDAIGWLS